MKMATKSAIPVNKHRIGNVTTVRELHHFGQGNLFLKIYNLSHKDVIGKELGCV